MAKAAALAAGVALMAGAAGLSAQDHSQHAQGAAKAGEVTLVGCVEMEKDYRARMDAGKGGVLGSGVGAANEYILSFAKAAADPKARGGATASMMGDYSLTGKAEPELMRQVGRQIEVIGKVEAIEAHRSGEDAKELPRLTISTWHPVADFCPAMKK